MTKKSVFCIATIRNQADQIVDHLKIESFSNKDISLLFPDTTHDPVPPKQTKSVAGPFIGPVKGSGIGVVLDWIAGIGPLAIPGVGPFIAAGPVMAALSGTALGAAGRAIVSGLIGLGVPESEARRYEGRINEGNFLISVHTEDVGDIARATAIFKQAGAQDIYATNQASIHGDSHREAASQALPPAEPEMSVAHAE